MERSLDERIVMPLSQRYYLADAKFLVALGGDEDLLGAIGSALVRPRWPLYLGRRSCPADLPLVVDARRPYANAREALESEPWIAASWYRNRCERRGVPFPELEVAFDGREGEQCESRSDLPLGFGAIRRYANRPVLVGRIANPDAPKGVAADGGLLLDPVAKPDHDPMDF